MQASGSKSLPSIGFLAVVEDAEQGLFGGYLVVNTFSRPLEFHCTTPVKPNRAQEILYGPTLKPYLYGEQIGQTLLGRSKSQPRLVFVDEEAALCVRQFVSTPVVLVLSEMSNAPPKSTLARFSLAGRGVAVDAAYEADREAIVRQSQDILGELDLLEPFQRIREAIQEARRAAA